jgi:hypothetical protein
VRILSKILLIFVVLGLPAGELSALEIVAHRALYRVTLERAPSSGVSAVSGNMSVDWRNGCSGWTFEYRSVINVSQAESPEISLLTAATTWEAQDGSEYRFNVRHSTNGRELEKIEGHGTILAPGAGGEVTFTAPRPRQLTLPVGTLFPMAHSRAVLRAAERGKAPVFLPLPVFDGMDEQSLYLVNVVIGKAGSGKSKYPAPSEEVGRLLRGHKTWPVNLAYFKANDRQPVPSHEMNLIMHDNGISDQLVMDFTDFTIRASLEKLEIQPPEDCGKR